MRLQHPIFHGPLDPQLELAEAHKPPNYDTWPGGSDMPDKIQTWRVQTKTFPEIDAGLVSDPFGFEDSPECEWISSGLNSKGPQSMTIGRQGNLFLWGFAAGPSDLTESGRRVLVNSIVYMRQFDNSMPLVTTLGGSPWQSREWSLVYSHYLRLPFEDKAQRDSFVKKLIPKRVLDTTGLDDGAISSYYESNMEMLRLVEAPSEDENGGRSLQFDVDDDCKALGVGNREQQFIPALLERLERDPQDPVGVTLAKRYLPEATSTEPAALRAWYEANRPYLFFSDRAGFKWMVNEQAKRSQLTSK